MEGRLKHNTSNQEPLAVRPSFWLKVNVCFNVVFSFFFLFIACDFPKCLGKYGSVVGTTSHSKYPETVAEIWRWITETLCLSTDRDSADEHTQRYVQSQSNCTLFIFGSCKRNILCKNFTCHYKELVCFANTVEFYGYTTHIFLLML